MYTITYKLRHVCTPNDSIPVPYYWRQSCTQSSNFAPIKVQSAEFCTFAHLLLCTLKVQTCTYIIFTPLRDFSGCKYWWSLKGAGVHAFTGANMNIRCAISRHLWVQLFMPKVHVATNDLGHVGCRLEPLFLGVYMGRWITFSPCISTMRKSDVDNQIWCRLTFSSVYKEIEWPYRSGEKRRNFQGPAILTGQVYEPKKIWRGKKYLHLNFENHFLF